MTLFSDDLILLLSVDIVSSAAFKANSSSEMGRLSWVQAFAAFYQRVPLILDSERAKLQLSGPLDLWKSIGDQLVFLVRPHSAEQLEQECLAFVRGLRQASQELLKQWGFELHGVAWAFVEGGDNATFRFQAPQLSGGTGFDLIGPDVDLGFRLVSFAPDGGVLAPLSLRSLLPQSALQMRLIGEADLKGIELRPYPLLQLHEVSSP